MSGINQFLNDVNVVDTISTQNASSRFMYNSWNKRENCKFGCEIIITIILVFI